MSARKSPASHVRPHRPGSKEITAQTEGEHV